MLLSEPPRSPYDLNFHVLRIPVRVHPLFWVVALLLGLRGNPEPWDMVFWVGAVFISILVHELGHAMAARAHGWEPWITLYGMGGLASYQPTHRSPRSRIVITLAGPFAGFAFALAICGVVAASGHRVLPIWESEWPLPVIWEPYPPRAQLLVFDLLYINIFWGLVNLLPIYPLDGGQIAREVFELVNVPDGVRLSLWLSIFSATGMAVVALLRLENQFMAFFFGYLAYMSYSSMQQMYGTRGGWGGYR